MYGTYAREAPVCLGKLAVDPLYLLGNRSNRISGGWVPLTLHPQGAGHPDEVTVVTLVVEIQLFRSGSTSGGWPIIY